MSDAKGRSMPTAKEAMEARELSARRRMAFGFVCGLILSIVFTLGLFASLA